MTLGPFAGLCLLRPVSSSFAYLQPLGLEFGSTKLTQMAWIVGMGSRTKTGKPFWLVASKLLTDVDRNYPKK